MPTYFDFITPDKPENRSLLPLTGSAKARPTFSRTQSYRNSFTSLDVVSDKSSSDGIISADPIVPRQHSVVQKPILPDKAIKPNSIDKHHVVANKKNTAVRLAGMLFFIVVSFSLLIGGASMLWPGASEFVPESSVSASVQSNDQEDVPEDLPVSPTTPSRMSTWRLSIPTINLDAAIEEVGLTAGGNMAVPNNFTNVGWLKQGAKIGQPGTAVLAGHLNKGKNKPAVFWDLNKLKTGDYVHIADGTKPKLRFRVTATQNYDIDRAPLDKIFSSTEGTKLNLITCSGKWDKNRNDYTKRLVIFTELAP